MKNQIAILLFLIFFFQISYAVKPATNRFLVTGYLNSNWIKPTTDVEFITQLDRIFFFGMSPDKNGEFTVNDQYIANYKLVKSKMKKEQEILLVVGGGGLVANMHVMGNDSLKREAYVKKITDFAKKYKFDGIDIDWENDNSSTPRKLVPTKNLIAFIKSIRKKLPSQKIITASMNGSSVNQTAEIYNLLEDVNLRYYASLNKEGLHASIPTVKEGLQKHITAKTPNNKIIVGVPFYARGANHKTIYYRDIVNNLTPRDTITSMYDGCSFNSVQIMREKVKYFKEQGYKGIMIWELTQDAPYSHPMSLLKSICNEAKAKKF